MRQLVQPRSQRRKCWTCFPTKSHLQHQNQSSFCTESLQLPLTWRPRPRFLRRFRHHRRSRAQDGPPLDHGGAGRTLPYAHHPAPEKGHRRRGPGRHHRSGELARRRRFPLLPTRAQPVAARRWGQWVINKEYNAEMLAEALCKLEGFTYAPSDAHYWKHGHCTERDFIYVTTQT